MDWLPDRWFRPRGWILIASGLLALFLAQVLGRRDLLVAAVFLLALPLLAGLGLHFLAPGFTVRRSFSPAFVDTDTSAVVTVEVRGSTPGGGSARLTEQLPPHLLNLPRFDYPNPVTPRSLLSRYSYTIRPRRRGVFTVGPLTARFQDPFDVAMLTRRLDNGDTLTVAPAAVPLAAMSLTGGRGQDGNRMTRQQANPSNDDVMVREYRHGDPLRRVHWPATARQGRLMVRAEESVTTPEAALILDQRLGAYGGSAKGGRAKDALLTTASFEWAVTAAVSIAAHLLERNYTLRVLDDQGRPAFHTSRSAPEPEREDYQGQAGLLAVAQSLAALELSVRRYDGGASWGADVTDKVGTDGDGGAHGVTGGGVKAGGGVTADGGDAHSGGVHGSSAHGGREGRGTSAHGGREGHGGGRAPLAEAVVDRLFQTRRRGPVVAVTGLLSMQDARVLAAAAGAAEGAFALLACPDPQLAQAALDILRRAGWQAAAAAPGTPLRQVWHELDTPLIPDAPGGYGSGGVYGLGAGHGLGTGHDGGHGQAGGHGLDGGQAGGHGLDGGQAGAHHIGHTAGHAAGHGAGHGAGHAGGGTRQ